MSKIDLAFDNQIYSIDESQLDNSRQTLTEHLEESMSGTGATINLGGTTYNVDSTKLSATTTTFVSHLGTVSGSGMKVVVNGVEYGVDSTKMTSAIADLHEVLDGLESGGSEESTIILLSFDNYILKDSNGVYLTAKEDN